MTMPKKKFVWDVERKGRQGLIMMLNLLLALGVKREPGRPEKWGSQTAVWEVALPFQIASDSQVCNRD